MTDIQIQRTRTVQFRAMHEGPTPLQVANAWDATSARVLAAAGAAAIGTTSFGVALDHGVWDGEQLPVEVALDAAASIVGAVDVPVTIDIEAGRGATPADVERTVAAVIACGAAGINIEDGVPGQSGALFDATDQADRIAAARAAADASGVPIFINARCDVFFGADVPADGRVAEVLLRAKSYRDAGADGLFLPGLLDVDTIRTLVGQVGLPVNIMVGTGAPPLADLAAAGVRRLSQGGEPFVAVVGMIKQLTERYLAGEFAAPPESLAAGATILPALVS